MNDTITIEVVCARQDELARLIDQLSAQREEKPRLYMMKANVLCKPGERYAGTVLNDDGTVKHHLVLLPHKPPHDLDWYDSRVWAEGVGDGLPTRQEQALLFANCKDALDARWYWSGEENGDSWAWNCNFSDGTQHDSRKSARGCARAVRRVS